METKKKFKLTDERIQLPNGTELRRIRALRDFADVKAGDLGGFVEHEDNLSQEGDAWVYGNARVWGNAQVYGDAEVYGNAMIDSDDAHCGFDCFGSENRHTHAYRVKGGGVEVTCGCFRGTLEEFRKRVEKTHGGTIYEWQYKAIIEVIKIKFGLE